MNLYDKQSYYSKLKFVKNDKNDHNVNINITLTTNHTLSDDILKQIENNINKLLLKDYEKFDDYQVRKEQENELLKQEKQNKIQVEKQQKEQMKKYTISQELKKNKLEQERKLKEQNKTLNKYKK